MRAACLALSSLAARAEESSAPRLDFSLAEEAPPLPETATALNGVIWPEMHVDKSEAHFFGIGDWGGDRGGHTWENPGRASKRGGKVSDIDDHAQKYVAMAMKKRAAKVDPDFVLNAGDNFYPGGITTKCDPAKNRNRKDPTHQIKDVWQKQYEGLGLTDKPWFSVLGNHDFGGFAFGAGWDQQIFHTWHSGGTWRMPSLFWSQVVRYRDFSVEVFNLDSNFMDAWHVKHGKTDFHSICQVKGSKVASECEGITLDNCPHKMREIWDDGLEWLETRLKASTATWRIINTHFPGPAIAGQPKIQALNAKYGIDLLFTGHTHNQQVGESKGIPWIISGGGGGVTSDSKPSTSGHDSAYGYMDFTVTKDTLRYDIMSWGGFSSEEISTHSRTLHRKRFANATAEVFV